MNMKKLKRVINKPPPDADKARQEIIEAAGKEIAAVLEKYKLELDPQMIISAGKIEPRIGLKFKA